MQATKTWSRANSTSRKTQEPSEACTPQGRSNALVEHLKGCTYKLPEQEQRALLHKMVSTYHMWVMKAMLMVDAMPGSDDDAKVAGFVLLFPSLRLAGHDATSILKCGSDLVKHLTRVWKLPSYCRLSARRS